MMNSGLTFGSEGPMMEGTWYNTRTGDSFTVRDSFFEDNQFVVTTTDGRYLKYEQIQDYIKSDKPIEMKKPEPKQEALPAEVAGLLEDTNYDDMIMADDYSSLPSFMRDALVVCDAQFVSGVASGQSVNAVFTKAYFKHLYSVCKNDKILKKLYEYKKAR